MKKGLYITIDGVEGTGKSTVCNELFKRLPSELNKEVILVREPGGTKVGEEIRQILINNKLDPETELYLFLAQRNELIDTVIKPALAKGKVVVSDRSFYSSYSMQGYASGLGVSKVDKMHKKFIDKLKPIESFFLDIDPKIGLERKGKSNDANVFEEKGLKYHELVRQGYNALREIFDVNFIDATSSVEDVTQQIIDTLKKKHIK